MHTIHGYYLAFYKFHHEKIPHIVTTSYASSYLFITLEQLKIFIFLEWLENLTGYRNFNICLKTTTHCICNRVTCAITYILLKFINKNVLRIFNDIAPISLKLVCSPKLIFY